jgi:streptogramin lyase
MRTKGARRKRVLIVLGACAGVVLIAIVAASVIPRLAPQPKPSASTSVSAGTFTAFATGSNAPANITAGPDGNVWFTSYCDGGNCGAFPTYCARSECGATIGRITPQGVIEHFPIPFTYSAPDNIVTGPDGNLWFIQYDQIRRISPDGVLTDFGEKLDGSRSIVGGADGNLWFTEEGGIGRMTPAGVITHFRPASGSLDTAGITGGPDGNLWFTETNGARVGRVTPNGAITEFAMPGARLEAGEEAEGAGSVTGYAVITAGADGNLWYADPALPYIGRITPEGVVTRFLLPAGKADIDALARPAGVTAITRGPDGAMWFLTTCQCVSGAPPAYLGRITLAGAITLIPFPVARPVALTAGPDGAIWITEESHIWRYMLPK